MADTTDFRAILSLKIKRLRKGRGLTLADLAKASGLSVSYLSQLEAGQKYPTPPRMASLASALGCSYDELTSTKLERDDRALHAFLNSPAVKDFPFELFGILSNDVTRLLTRSPAEVTALLRAIGDFARQFDIDGEHFFDAALRAYQESTGNYYVAIEQQAEEFARRLGRSGLCADVAGLRGWLTANGVREIDERVLRDHSVLVKYASVFVDASQRLLLNPRLSDSYKVFLLARETGYRVLGLEAQARTEPRGKVVSFDHVRDDFHAMYFADALLMPRRACGRVGMGTRRGVSESVRKCWTQMSAIGRVACLARRPTGRICGRDWRSWLAGRRRLVTMPRWRSRSMRRGPWIRSTR